MLLIQKIGKKLFFISLIFTSSGFMFNSIGQFSAGLGLAAETDNNMAGLQIHAKYLGKSTPLGFTINGVYFFPEERDEIELDAWEANLNIQYHLDVRFIFNPYLISGVHYFRQEFGNEHTDRIGFNTGFGLESDSDIVRFYSELIVSISERTRFLAAVGLRFPF